MRFEREIVQHVDGTWWVHDDAASRSVVVGPFRSREEAMACPMPALPNIAIETDIQLASSMLL
jgi:hypothetical protein